MVGCLRLAFFVLNTVLINRQLNNKLGIYLQSVTDSIRHPQVLDKLQIPLQ